MMFENVQTIFNPTTNVGWVMKGQLILASYCTISIYSVRPCDRDTFDGFGNSVLTIDYRDIKEISVDPVIDLVNLWVTPVNI